MGVSDGTASGNGVLSNGVSEGCRRDEVGAGMINDSEVIGEDITSTVKISVGERTHPKMGNRIKNTVKSNLAVVLLARLIMFFKR